MRHLPNVLYPEQLKKLFRVVSSPKSAMLYAMAFFHGLRSQEVRRLKVRNINLDEGVIKIERSKGDKDRYVTIPPCMIPIIKKWLEYIGDCEYFFPTRSNNSVEYDRETMQKRFKSDLKKSGLLVPEKKDTKGRQRYVYRFHTLRHSYASYLINNGVDLFTIMKLMGHNNIQTTQIYVHISQSDAKKHLERLFGDNKK